MRNVVLAVAMLVGASACGGAAAPGRPPDLTGEITSVSGTPGRTVVLVEEHPGQPAGGQKAAVTVEGSTQVLRTSGGPPVRATDADLRVGIRVSVWFAGPVAESYPVQGKAEAIVIHASP